MKSFLTLIVIAVCILSMCNLASAGFGPCPDAPYLHDDFNATKFRGLWYLYSVSNDYYDSFQNECRTDLIMSRGNNTEDYDYKVFTSTFDKDTNRTQRYGRQIIFQDETVPRASAFNEGGFWPTYIDVLKTDHYSYAIMQV